jgi:hypothetical protein
MPFGVCNEPTTFQTCMLAIFSYVVDANLVITWSRNPHAKTSIPGKPNKSSLIRVWHKDNLYLGTNTIENENPHQMNIDSWTRSIRMTPRSQLFFDKSFFSFLKKHKRESIPLTHTHKVQQTRIFINLNYLTYISDYVFIYIDSRLKQTLMNPLCRLICCPLTIKLK